MRYDVLIIGAGITGLSSAYFAAKSGKKVLLLSNETPGGSILSEKIDQFTIERGAAILVELPELAELIDQLNLRQEVVYPSTRSFLQAIWVDGKIHLVPKSLASLLRTQLLTPWNRITLPLRVLFGKLKVPKEHDTSIGEVARPFLGQKGVDLMLTPTLRAAYGQSAFSISARTLLQKAIKQADNIRPLALLKARKGRRGFMLRSGNKILITRLFEKFQELGGEFKTLRVQNIRHHTEYFTVDTSDAQSFEATKLVLSSAIDLVPQVSSDFASSLCPGVPLAIVHFELPSNALDNLGMQLTKPLLGILVPKGEIFGVMFPSQIFPHVAPKGKILSAVYLGGSDWQKGIPDKSEVLEMAINGLEMLIPKCQYRHLQTTIWPSAIPNYQIGCDEIDRRLKELERSVPGFFAPLRERGSPGVADRVRVAANVGEIN